ncbi:MAG: hypothetical protein IPK14_14005 [Blastocatellia bacterium]|nr:hypothetical protein [Blastocatellia bacterium]
MEGYNAKSDIEENRMAWEKAEKLNLKLTGGSDAHLSRPNRKMCNRISI